MKNDCAYLELLIVEELHSLIVQQGIHSLASSQVVQLVDLLSCLQSPAGQYLSKAKVRRCSTGIRICTRLKMDILQSVSSSIGRHRDDIIGCIKLPNAPRQQLW